MRIFALLALALLSTTVPVYAQVGDGTEEPDGYAPPAYDSSVTDLLREHIDAGGLYPEHAGMTGASHVRFYEFQMPASSAAHPDPYGGLILRVYLEPAPFGFGMLHERPIPPSVIGRPVHPVLTLEDLRYLLCLVRSGTCEAPSS